MTAKKERSTDRPVKRKQKQTPAPRSSIPFAIIVFVSIIILTVGAYIVWGGLDVAKENQVSTIPPESAESGESTEAPPDRNYTIVSDRTTIRTEIDEKTTGWSVFTNETHGITFKYPAGWTVDEQPIGEPDDQIPAISISSDNVIARIIFPPNISPSSCWYDGENSDQDGVHFVSFKQILGYSTDIRRGTREITTSSLQLCSLDPITRTYTNWLPGVAFIDQSSPLTEENLDTLDTIFSTYNTLP